MSYQVLARKWRPPKFSDIVGQQLITRSLENAIRSGRVAHAFLFAGVRGVGKTTTARVLAKALNCHRGITPEPCGECPSCLEIAASNSVDVQEIDAASNTGVDNIREIRESVRYGAARDRFKIFIIDEVHMLSTAAFNALLKTLEEPPPHVKFILATTELNKIPVTITSRCQQFDFKPIPFAQLLERLRLICREEGVNISDYGLRAVASAARGSMRDAQSTLDQMISLSGQEIPDEDVRVLLGVVDEKVLAALVDAVTARDRSELLRQMSALADSGVDPHGFCRKFIAYVRNLLVCRVAGWDPRLLHLPDSDREMLEKQSAAFTELDLIRFYDLLGKTENELRYHPHPHVHLEMALMKLVELASLPTLEEAIGRLGGGRAELPAGPPRPSRPATPPSRSPQPPRSAPPSAARPASAAPTPSPNRTPPASRTAEPPRDSPAEAPASEARIPPGETVGYLMTALQKDHIRIFSSLEHALRVEFKNGRLEAVFPAHEKFHLSTVAAPDGRKVLSEVCARITGSPPEVVVRADEPATQSGDAAKPSSKDPMDDPQVKLFYDAFPGKVRIDPEDGS